MIDGIAYDFGPLPVRANVHTMGSDVWLQATFLQNELN